MVYILYYICIELLIKHSDKTNKISGFILHGYLIITKNYLKKENNPHKKFANQTNKYMAKPIKETPLLQGKDAVRFVETMKNTSAKKVDQKELERMRESFNKIKAISSF